MFSGLFKNYDDVQFRKPAQHSVLRNRITAENNERLADYITPKRRRDRFPKTTPRTPGIVQHERHGAHIVQIPNRGHAHRLAITFTQK